jgi:hypothetical protein
MGHIDKLTANTSDFAQLGNALAYVGTADVAGFSPAEELAFA